MLLTPFYLEKGGYQINTAQDAVETSTPFQMLDFNLIVAVLRLPHPKLGEVIFMQKNPEIVPSSLINLPGC